MTIVFPGLQCDMMLVIASIGSEGLLGTEALKSCLPHQLDLRTGQLWADGQSTLQLHQQCQAVWASAYTQGSLVVPPDSEILAPRLDLVPGGHPPGSLLHDQTGFSNYGKLLCIGRSYLGRHVELVC